MEKDLRNKIIRMRKDLTIKTIRFMIDANIKLPSIKYEVDDNMIRFSGVPEDVILQWRIFEDLSGIINIRGVGNIKTYPKPNEVLDQLTIIYSHKEYTFDV